jgi:hypothetical protein
MALKTDRYEMQTDISYFMTSAQSRGGVASLVTGGSGAAMDQGVNLVSYAALPANAKPVGLLLNDVVDNDLTRVPPNRYKNEVQVGGKVTLLRKGYVVTNMILGTPAAGGSAFIGHSGNIATTNIGGNATVIGMFMSSKDQDGYAKVEINLPVTL